MKAWLLRVGQYYLIPGEYLRPTTSWGHRLKVQTTDVNKILELLNAPPPELIEVLTETDTNGTVWYILQLPEGGTSKVSYKYNSELHSLACAVRREYYREQKELGGKYWRLEHHE